MNDLPPSSLKTWRSVAFGLGVLILFWLPIEDQSILVPVLLAVAAAVAAVGFARLKYALRPPIAGILGGLIVSPITLLWMAFKTGLHGHGAPDFSAQQILQVIQLAPVWTLAGGLLGWGWQALAHKKQS